MKTSTTPLILGHSSILKMKMSSNSSETLI